MKKNKESSKKRSFIVTRLIILIVLISANTFAWFIYATKIDNSVSVHVKGWNVTFEANENEVTNEVDVIVDDLYPGMDDYEYSISAYNNSEVTANFTYQILEARILTTTYVTVEGRNARGQTVQPSDLTSSALQTMLASNYPFEITLGTSGSLINTNNSHQDFTLNVEWPYESNQDDVDTTWGINAHNYKTSNPTSPSIALVIKLIITQNPS